MKHYSANLEDNNVVEDGGRLLIDNSRTKGTALSSFDSLADTVNGLVIASTNANFILDAQGSEFDPKGSNDILNYVRTVGFSTATNEENILVLDYTASHDLSTDGDFNVDLGHLDYHLQFGELVGSELRLYASADNSGDRLATVNLSGLGGGTGGGAATNPTNATLPVKFEDQFLNEYFEDSLISESGTITAPTTVAATTDAAITGSSTSQTIAITLGSSSTAFHTRFSAGVASTTIFIGGESYTGTLTSTSNGAAAEFTGVVTDSHASGVAVILPETAPVYNPDTVVINGNLQVVGTQTAVNQRTVELNDSFLVLNSVDPTVPTADITAANGGLIVLTDVDESADSAVYAGLRYNATADQWEVAHNLNADSGAGSTGTNPATQNTWVPISTTNGTTNKAVINVASIGAGSGDTAGAVGTITSSFDGDASADQNDITVTAPSPNAGGAVTVAIAHSGSTEFPFGNDDLMVQVFESGSMVIPDAIALGTNTVTVTLPHGYTGSNLKIIIIG